MKPKIIPLHIMLILCTAIALVSCSKDSSPNNAYTNNNTNTNPTNTGNTVSISGYGFSPSSLSVKAGTTVTWTNNDNTSHTVSFSSFGSGDMKYGDTYSYTFNTAGTFAYRCAYHSAMIGSVVVSQ